MVVLSLVTSTAKTLWTESLSTALEFTNTDKPTFPAKASNLSLLVKSLPREPLFSTRNHNSLYYILYSFCDFTHLSNQLSELTNFDAQAYTELASRLAGLFVSDYWRLMKIIKNSKGEPDGNFKIGKAFGEIVYKILDAAFWDYYSYKPYIKNNC